MVRMDCLTKYYLYLWDTILKVGGGISGLGIIAALCEF